MSRLVRLYPTAWRERYEDEMAALLEDRPPGPFDLLDLLLGAIDAHLHLRDPLKHSNHRKGIPMTLRIAGSAAILGGGLWILFFAFVGLAYTGAALGFDVDLLWFPAVLGAGLLLLIALGGLSAFEFRHHARRVWIAFAMPAVGIGLVFAALARTLLTGDWNYDSGSFGVLLLYPGLLLVLIGSVIFAAALGPSHGLRRIGALAIGLGAALTVPALGSFLPPIGLVGGGLAFGAGWIGLGIEAVRRERPAIGSPQSTA